MRERTKHRIKRFFIALGVLLGTLLLIPSPFCLIPRFCGGFSFWIYGAQTYVNVPGYLSLIFFGSWLTGVVGGILGMVAAVFRPEKYEQRYCEHCQTVTEQFLSKTKYKKGFKYKMGMKPEVLKAARVSYQYTCERCGQKFNVPNPDYNPAEPKDDWRLHQYARKETETERDTAKLQAINCAVCNRKMTLIDKEERKWYCATDDRLYLAKQDQVIENAMRGTSSQQSKPATEQEVIIPKLEPSMMFCRECGAKIPRSSKFCKECGSAQS